MSFSDKKMVYMLLCGGAIAISLNLAAIAAAIPVISVGLGLPEFDVAKVITYYMIPYGIGALMYAPLTNRLTYRTILVGSMLGFGIGCMICGLAQTLEVLLAGRVLMGLSGSGAIPLGLMIIGELFDRDVRGRLVGLFFSSSFVANFVGIALVAFTDWQWIFYVPGILALIMAVAFLVLGKGLLSHRNQAKVSYQISLSNPVIVKIFIWVFAISFLYHAVQKWYGVYMSQDYGLDKKMISLLFIVSMLGGTVGQNIGGWISDKYSRVLTCYVGVIGLGLSVMALAGHYSVVVLAIILFLATAFWTVGHNGLSTILTDASHQDRPVMASLNSSMRFLSGGVGFLISGFFVEKSFSSTFLTIGILMVLLTFVLKYLVRAQT